MPRRKTRPRGAGPSSHVAAYRLPSNDARERAHHDRGGARLAVVGEPRLRSRVNPEPDGPIVAVTAARAAVLEPEREAVPGPRVEPGDRVAEHRRGRRSGVDPRRDREPVAPGPGRGRPSSRPAACSRATGRRTPGSTDGPNPTSPMGFACRPRPDVSRPSAMRSQAPTGDGSPSGRRSAGSMELILTCLSGAWSHGDDRRRPS